MEANDELPDDFDQAYNWFTKMYSEHKEKQVQMTQKDKLLNDQEQFAFSRFIDNVLDDPGHATDSLEVEWLDQKPRQDFYRGFRDHQLSGALPTLVRHSPAAEPPIYPGQHPQHVYEPAQPQLPPQPQYMPHNRVVPKEESPPWDRIDSKKDMKITKQKFLSEDQVRQNHTYSEKRRRDLISHHFKAMCSLVPTIAQSPPNLAKSIVLQHVYDFILNTASENKRIRGVLEQNSVDTAGVVAHRPKSHE